MHAPLVRLEADRTCANEAAIRPVAFCPANLAGLPRDFGPAIKELDRLGIARAYADNVIADRITFATGERIIVAEGRSNALRVSPAGGVIPKPDDPSLRPRHPQYNEIVSRTTFPAWIVAKDFDVGNIDYGAFSQAGYSSKEVGQLTIYYHAGASQTGSTP